MGNRLPAEVSFPLFFLNYFCLLNFWLQGLPCCAGFPHFPRAGAALQRGVRLLVAVASRAELRL